MCVCTSKNATNKLTAIGPNGNLIIMVGRNLAKRDPTSHTLDYYTGKEEDRSCAILGMTTIQHLQEELFYMTRESAELKVCRHPKMSTI